MKDQSQGQWSILTLIQMSFFFLFFFFSFFRSIGELDVAFLPLADSSGCVQLLIQKNRWNDFLSSVKIDSVVKASGVLQARPEKDQKSVGTCI